jgi:hypothetical protein
MGVKLGLVSTCKFAVSVLSWFSVLWIVPIMSKVRKKGPMFSCPIVSLTLKLLLSFWPLLFLSPASSIRSHLCKPTRECLCYEYRIILRCTCNLILKLQFQVIFAVLCAIGSNNSGLITQTGPSGTDEDVGSTCTLQPTYRILLGIWFIKMCFNRLTTLRD